jgi:hypothetical protein
MSTRVKNFQAADFVNANDTEVLVSRPYLGSFEGTIISQTLSPSIAVVAGDTSITLDSPLTDPILPRTELSFGIVDVIVTATALAGTSTLSIEPAPAAIAATATATFDNLFQVYSLNQANDQMNTEQKEDRVFKSGFFKSRATTTATYEVQCQGKEIIDDPGLEQIFLAGRSGLKVFFKMITGTEIITAWAFPMSPSKNRQLDQSVDVSFNLSIDGTPIFAPLV